MAILQLPRDSTGKMIIPGRVIKEMVWPFLIDPTLPPTLQDTSTGSSSVGIINATGTPSGASGYITLNSVSATKAQVKTSQPIWLPSFEAVLWEVQGISNNDNNVGSLNIGLASNSSNGAYINVAFSPSATPQSTMYTGNGTNPVGINYCIQANHRNLGLLLLPHYQQAYLLEDDQVMGAVDYTGALIATGYVIPDVNLTATTGNNSTIRIQQLKLTLWSY